MPGGRFGAFFDEEVDGFAACALEVATSLATSRCCAFPARARLRRKRDTEFAFAIKPPTCLCCTAEYQLVQQDRVSERPISRIAVIICRGESIPLSPGESPEKTIGSRTRCAAHGLMAFSRSALRA